MATCPLEMTAQEFADIQRCEAVVIREYERADGSRWAIPVAWGDADEMRDQAEIPGLFVVPVGLKIVGHVFKLTADLFKPMETPAHAD